MNVVLYGATGMIGSRVLQELVSRGHRVVAIVRNPGKVPALAGVRAIEGSALDAADIAAKAKDADVVVSSYASPAGEESKVIDSVRALIDGTKAAHAKRLLVVGGAGSLLVAPGVDVIDSGHLPAAYRPAAIAHREALALLKESDVDWTYFSPAGAIEPGERTGKFRVGGDSLIADEKGVSRISAEDYAIALVDELEKPQYIRKRFTVGY
jgi:uncharacterized protein